MKQENKFVAQLFHYLAPFVDLEKELFICVDGGAAKAHSGGSASPLIDPAVPDLWLTLIGQEQAFGIEAKVLDHNKISVRQSQISAWRSDGTGHYKPTFWVATNREQSEYWCWSHSALVDCLNRTKSKQANVSLSIGRYAALHHSRSLPGLALHLLTHAS